MTFNDLLLRLEPLQQKAIRLVYLEDRTPAEAARVLAVERVVVAAALALAFRRIARWITEEEEQEDA